MGLLSTENGIPYRKNLGGAWLAPCCLLAGCTVGWNNVSSVGQEEGAEVKPVRVEKLADARGQTLTVVKVNYAPGGKSGKHHAGGVNEPIRATWCSHLR